ncbi:MAG: hypothetical protein N4A38_04250 [Candidatus Gracilibacteria bacterium]|nr:hypothetical protein [Candidatus Gracilibacteria bacterium]
MQKKIRIGRSLKDSKAVIDRLVELNVNGKLDSYLKKFDGQETIMEIRVDQDKKGLFKSKIAFITDHNSYRFERTKYKKLDDLVNHMFKLLKETLARA